MKIMLDEIVNSINFKDSDDVKMIDFDTDKNEVYVLTTYGDFTLKVQCGIPEEVTQNIEALETALEVSGWIDTKE